MRSKNKKVNESNIIHDIIEQIYPILEMEMELNEISSVDWGDIADRADSLFQNDISAWAKKRQDAARQDEIKNTYENTFEEILTKDYKTKKFILGKYIPANIYILVCLKGDQRIAMVRVTQNSLVNIANNDITKDIAALYNNRKTIGKSNVHSIAIALEKDRREAQDLARKINSAIGSNISWRYFFGDSKPKKASPNPEMKYEYLKPFLIDGTPYKVCMAKSISEARNEHNATSYTIFYALISDGNYSCIIRVYKVEKGVNLYGHGQPGPLYKVFQNHHVTAGIPAPDPKSSNIVNIYDFLRSIRSGIRKSIFNGISAHVGKNVSMEDVEHRYNVVIDAIEKKRTDGKYPDALEDPLNPYDKDYETDSNDVDDPDDPDEAGTTSDFISY